jgi:hypothetical protein
LFDDRQALPSSTARRPILPGSNGVDAIRLATLALSIRAGRT